MPLIHPPGLSTQPDQIITQAEQRNALLNAGVGPVYLHAGHVTANRATFNLGRSADGINIVPIADRIPFTVPLTALGDDQMRDPVVFYYKPTREFICFYTHAGSGVNPNGGNGYATSLGVCKTRDLSRWEYVGEIPVVWSGVDAPWFSWSGHAIVEDNGRVCITSSVVNNGSTQELVIGWMEFTSPGVDWTAVTNFVPMERDNLNYAAHIATHVQNNDMCVVKHEGVYHYFFDSGANGAHDIFHATSTFLFVNMTAPVSLGIRALVGLDVEGQYVVRNPENDGWILYLQIIFGPVQYIRLDENFAPIGSPAPVNWPVAMPVGNGSALKLQDLDASNALLSAPILDQFTDVNYVNSTKRYLLPVGTYMSGKFKGSTLGNGSGIGRTGNTNSNTTLNGLAKTSDLQVGMSVSGSGIPAGTIIASITNNTTVVLSQAATTTVVGGNISFDDQIWYQVTRDAAGTISTTLFGAIYNGGITIQGNNNAIYIQTATGLPRLWMERQGTGVAYQYIILGSDMYLTGGAAASGYVGFKLGADGILTIGPGAGDSIKKAVQVGVGGIKYPLSSTDVESGAWWDNGTTLVKKP